MNMESINQSYSIYAGYVLAPLRFMGFAMSTIGLACSLSFLDRFHGTTVFNNISVNVLCPLFKLF